MWYYLAILFGAVSIFVVGAFYVLWSARKETAGKIKVDMRTVNGEADDFLAEIQGDFVVFPKNKQAYVKTIGSNELETKTKQIELHYFYDSRAVVRDYHPSKKGLMSILSAPIERISYNEGDPVPIVVEAGDA